MNEFLSNTRNKMEFISLNDKMGANETCNVMHKVISINIRKVIYFTFCIYFYFKHILFGEDAKFNNKKAYFSNSIEKHRS